MLRKIRASNAYKKESEISNERYGEIRQAHAHTQREREKEREREREREVSHLEFLIRLVLLEIFKGIYVRYFADSEPAR